MSDERVGTEQRTRVLDLLSRALSEGYLSLEEYEQRLVAVNSSTHASHLLTQVHDLPPQFRWDPRVPAPASPAADRTVDTFAMTALILGIMSIPLAVCLVGALLGVAAIVFSVPGSRGVGGWGRAQTGRLLGVIGILLSAGVGLLAVLGTMTSP